MDTPHPLKLGGAYGSPYTLKMRAVLRYRRIPFTWVLRDSKWDDLPPVPVRLIPVIAFPDERRGLQRGSDRLEPAHHATRGDAPRTQPRAHRPGGGVPRLPHRGLRGRVGDQGDVPLPLVLRRGHRQGRLAVAARLEPADVRRAVAEGQAIHHQATDLATGAGGFHRAEPARHRAVVRTSARAAASAASATGRSCWATGPAAATSASSANCASSSAGTRCRRVSPRRRRPGS